MTEDSFSLVKWFRDRRTSAITNKLMEHIAKVIDVCSEYVHAVIALTSEGKPFQARKDEAEAALKRVIIQERAADNIKEELFREISRVKIEAKMREDLFKLVYQIDPIANWIKVSAKNSLMSLELNVQISDDLWQRFRTIAEIVLTGSKLVKKTLEVLGIDDASLLNYRQEIETLEQSVDDLYFSVKKAIFAVDRPAQASLLALDILVGLENASDHCAGSADILYILVMANR
ncbi:MAG TPA: DUF47 family protein [Candidatus Hodarchaeales archaeon]|nr:DUF47 family protein [Candidatus Hodarchaeales archaeon]